MQEERDASGSRNAARSLIIALDRIDGYGNRELAEAYLELRDAVERTSVFTRANDAHALAGLHHQLRKPFTLATRADLLTWAAWLEASFAPTSCEVRKASIRRFYRYLSDPEAYADARLRDRLEPMPCASWISFRRNWGELPVEHVLVEDDVLALVRAADQPRDAALAAVLYESAARLAEFLALRVGHVQLAQDGATLTIAKSKTTARRVPLFLSAALLRAHVASHPDPRPEAPLWPSLDTRPAYKHHGLARGSLKGVLLVLAARGRVTKPVNPHAFRHARATVLARILTESELRQFMGWSPSSPMPRLYIHLSGGEAKTKLAAHYGVRAARRPDMSLWAQ